MQELQIGPKTLTLTWFTGKVMGSTKHLETKVSGGGGGGYSNRGTGYTAPVAITSTTTVHDQLFLVDPSGQERSYQLQNFDIACRETNEVTVLWAAKKGKQNGYNVLVYNHTTTKPTFQKNSLALLLKPWKLPFWIGALAVIYGSCKVAMTQKQSFGISAIVALAAIIVPIVIYKWLTNDRVKQFMSAINYKDLVASAP